jgi:ketosteroid isomerase-like protein
VVRVTPVDQARVATIRRIYALANEAYQQRSVDTQSMSELLDPGVRFDVTRFVFNPGVYEGIDGLRDFFEGSLEVWETFRTEPVEIVEASDAVVVVLDVSGRGRDGIEVRRTGGAVFRFRDGRVSEWVSGLDEDEMAALRAGG